MAPDAVWQRWGEARPEPAVIHLDTAACGRSSSAVLDAVAAHAVREATEGAYVVAEAAAPVLAGLRADLATLLAVPAEGIAFVESATAALAVALRVAGPPPGSAVAVAPSEWGPNLHAFAAAGLERRVLDVDDRGRIDLDHLAALGTDPPAFVHLTAQASHRAVRQPVREIVAVARELGVPVWVDAAQALGHTDVADGADVVYAPSRKWLAGPRGVGVVGFADPGSPLLRLDREPPPRPGAGPLDGVESHEAHVAGRVGLALAVGELLAAGPERVWARLDEVGRRSREVLAGVPGWELVDPVDAPGAITAIAPTDGQDVFAERARLLGRHRILTTPCATVRAPLDMDRPLLRVSPHVDVTDADLDRLADALRT